MRAPGRDRPALALARALAFALPAGPLAGAARAAAARLEYRGAVLAYPLAYWLA